MKGDFTRITYNERKHYALVLMQQGRVQLDSDWNEQALLHWLGMQRLTEDLIGEHAGPRNDSGFEIAQKYNPEGNLITSDFTITEGRYYVRGVMCENDDPVEYTKQDAYPFPDSVEIEESKIYLVYLHAWWRHITNVEDDDIREVALGGPDTASRIQTVWQVKIIEVDAGDARYKSDYEFFIQFLKDSGIYKRTTGKLQTQALKPADSDQPCITSPQSRYRGNENQLYRVEIHNSGPACTLDASTANTSCATFKWSRDNGSVVFPILDLSKETVTLAHLGRDDRFGLKVGDWVEVVNDNYELQRRTEPLFKVIEVDPDNMQVTLSADPQSSLSADIQLSDMAKHPLLRRWDHAGEATYSGTLPVEEGKWIDLEDGVQIQFPKQLAQDETTHWYQSGAWWWIPARNITGDVEWPQDNGQPLAQEALDAGYNYAPLALLESDGMNITDYRRKIKELWK